MKEEQEIHNQIKTSIEYLSNLVLENTGVHRDYKNTELGDAMLIFVEVFMSKIYDFHKDKGLTQEQLGVIAEEAGKSLRQTILLFSGVDLHKIYLQEPSPNITS